jgi:DNA-binding transcriptional LysR family regulator
MSLRQMEYLLAVVDERSFTRAAHRLGMSQPALSHQVRALEREVGQPLLERLPSSVRLTPMGRAYVPHAAGALRAATRARRVGQPPTDVRLRIATLYSLSQGVLPPAIRAWRTRYPGAEIDVREFPNLDELAAYMALGVADVGVGPVPRDWVGSVDPLGPEDLVLVLAPDDPVVAGGAEEVALEELADRSWVLYTADNMMSAVIEQACAAAGFSPRAAARTRHTAAAVQFAAAGLGPTIAPRSIIEADLPAAVLRVDPPLRREIAAFSAEGTGEVTASFLDAVRRYGAPRLSGRRARDGAPAAGEA